MSAVYGIVIVLALVVVFLAMLVAGLLRSHAEILRKLDSLGAGIDSRDHGGSLTVTSRRPTAESVEMANIVGIDPDGDPIAISPTAGDNPTLIAFLSTSCSSCTVFWEHIDQPEIVFGSRRHRVLVVTLGPEEESPTRAKSLRRGKADVVMSSQAWSDYEVPGAPYFVVADPGEGILGEGSADSYEALARFLEDSSNDQGWDRKRAQNVPSGDNQDRIDRDLRAAGIEPDDPRLHHQPGSVDGL